ncbi:GFA family protein [Rhodobacter sp. NTK016B]|uniref:GFA family protein n=1 Tax=Rhodobacter sp. NTK016B TaxID=2759676 RepID=UPI001A90B9C8|nr:GFA family protein [Rhodobacter sp. NTK016B]MBN8292724.1 GFA family protein [Rhodobacter sp. NTK016B]
MTGGTDHPDFRGGCQCGAVRYRVSAGPAKDCLCHCRMCQRATGNAFAPLIEVPATRITWTGTPAEWASSDLATRGFCATCGTPVYYRSGDTVEIMAGTLVPGLVVFAPQVHSASESRVDWLDRLPGMPDAPTPPGIAARIHSHQSPES